LSVTVGVPGLMLGGVGNRPTGSDLTRSRDPDTTRRSQSVPAYGVGRLSGVSGRARYPGPATRRFRPIVEWSDNEKYWLIRYRKVGIWATLCARIRELLIPRGGDRGRRRNTLGRGPRTDETPGGRAGGGARVSLSIVKSVLSGGVVEIAPRGEIDVDTAYEVREAIAEVLAKSRPLRIELNMRLVTFIDSVGISAMVAGFQTAEVSGVKLVVTEPSRFVHRQ